MHLFKSYTYAWWQIGIFKLALLAIGVAIGAYWSDFFLANMKAVLVVALIATIYTMYVSMRQVQP